ncbi:MAG TPA: TPM domain-containing protein [Xenococcaceae cyanobacterium]
MKTINILKYTIIFGFISSTILFIPLSSQALTVEEVINPRQKNGGWVTDMADILSDQTETELNSLISNLEQNNGTEIAVVTVIETAPAASPKAFATELFNYWGIGKAKENNGILFLVSVEDKRVEIETGYGIEPILSDTEVGKIIDTKITPQYKQGDFDRGTLDGTKALIVALDDSVARQNNSEKIGQISTNLSKINGVEKIFLVAAGTGLALIAGGIYWSYKKLNKYYLNPQKINIKLPRKNNRAIYCAKCRQPMEKVATIELTEPQKVAKKLGSTSYRGYKCVNCHHETQPYSIVAYVSNSSRYQNCPQCHEFTATRTQTTLKKATYSSKGKRLISDRCYCCDYLQEKTSDIPRLYSASNRSSSSSSSNHCSSGSGSSGSSSFGGGSSGGGGAGGGW